MIHQFVERRAKPASRHKMPGPGPHMIYTLGSGQALLHVTNGRFGPHHCVVYTINSFFGPDIGSFAEWLTSTLGLGRALGSSIEPWIHDPLYYVLILGLPLSVLYCWASRILLHKGLLDSVSGVSTWTEECVITKNYHFSYRFSAEFSSIVDASWFLISLS